MDQMDEDTSEDEVSLDGDGVYLEEGKKLNSKLNATQIKSSDTDFSNFHVSGTFNCSQLTSINMILSYYAVKM